MRRKYRSTDESITLESVLDELGHTNCTWIRPQESWQSNRRRFHREGRYVTVSTEPYRDEYVYTEPQPDAPIEWSTSYGDWVDSNPESVATPGPITGGYAVLGDVFVMPSYAGGSDYSGNLVEVSNHKALTELCEAAFPEGEGTDYLQYHGGHGTFGLAIRVASLVPDEKRLDEGEEGRLTEIIDALTSLSDYPLLDESLHSEMEIKSQNEAWESDIRRDFQQALGKYFKAEIEAGCATETEHENNFDRLACTQELADFASDDYNVWVTDDLANTWFYELAEYANEYWTNEEGSGSWIDVDDVVKNGINRELRSWPEGEAKRSALVTEIRKALESAYIGQWYGGLL